MAQVTSSVRDRGLMLSIAAVLAASVALASAPAASAAGKFDGDPIATSVFKAKFSKAFKKQLKRNGVKIKPLRLRISTRGNSDVDPTNGFTDLQLNKVIFNLNKKGQRICRGNGNSAKKCRKKVAFTKLTTSMPGVAKGSSGKLFRFSAPKTVTRNGFGADLSGVKVTLLKGAAKRINKRLGLNSLRKGSVSNNLSLSYQPLTVKVLGGQSQTLSSLAPGAVGLKAISHCVSGLSPNGFEAIAPATKNAAIPPTFTFPVTGGELSPIGEAGLLELGGGVSINKNNGAGSPAACAAQGPPGSANLTQVDLNTDVTARTVSSVVNITTVLPNTVFAGPRGRAVGQTTDPSNSVITADPVAKTISINGTIVRLAGVSADTLNGVFPNASGDPANNFAAGDPFGTSNLTVNTR